MKRAMASFLTVLSMLAAGGAASAAAPEGASARVLVLDPSGATIPGATVTLTPRGGAPMVRKTDEGGQALFGPLSPGVVAARAEMGGFEARERASINLKAGNNTIERRRRRSRDQDDGASDNRSQPVHVDGGGGGAD